MNVYVLVVLLAGLALYAFSFARRISYVAHFVLVPFVNRVHYPKVLETLTEHEHQQVHDEVDKYEMRMLLCYFAALISIVCAFVYLAFVLIGSAAPFTATITAVLFGYVLSNYNLLSKAEGWVYTVENDLLGRVVANKAAEQKYDSLSDYLQTENTKMIQQYNDIIIRGFQLMDEAMREAGFDPERDYDESDEARAEFERLSVKANELVKPKLDALEREILGEESPEPPEE